MFNSRSRVLLFAMIAGSGMLAACGGDAPEGQQAGPDTKTAKPALPKVAGLPAEMVAAVSAGRSANEIGVHFSLGSAPTVGTALTVAIAIVPHQEFTLVRAHFEGPDGLTMVSGDKLEALANPPGEKAINHQVVLVPSRDGVFVVTAVVETEGAVGSVTRVFSIPIIVTPAASAPAVSPSPTPPPKAG